MPSDRPTTPARLSLEESIRLDEELASLIRAGVPLEVGLRASAADLHGRLKRVIEGLATRLERGEPLPDALLQSGAAGSEARAAAVAAGLRSHRTPEALDALARHARAIVEVRRTLRYGLPYPALLIVLAVAMLGTLGVEYVRGLHANLDMLRADVSGPWTDVLTRIVGHLGGWGWALVVAPVVLLVLWLLLRPATVRGRWLIRLCPGGSAILRDLDRSTFSHLLGVLLESSVPLPEALRLAGESVADGRLRHAAERLADGVSSGGAFAAAALRERGLPPHLRWTLSAGGEGEMLPAMLARGAETYRRRAALRAARLRAVLPVATTLVVGGGVVFAYCLLLVVPMFEFLEVMSRPVTTP